MKTETSEPKIRRPLIEITRVDTRAATAALERIATALETLLSLPPYNYNITVPRPLVPGSREQESVDYYSDFEATRQEVSDLIHGHNTDEDGAD